MIPFALESRAGIQPSSTQSWVSVLLAVYGAALLVLSPLAGWYADRSSSRRLPLLIGLLALGGATVMLCLARTVALLVLGRILQGFSASIVWTVGLALLVDTVGEREIGQMLGYVMLSMSIGLLIAPLLGGIVYQQEGYYAVYYMAFALVVVDIVLRLVLVEKKLARQWISEPVRDDVDNIDSTTGTDTDNGVEKANLDTAGPESGTAPREEAPASETLREIEATVNTAYTKRSKWPPVFTLLKSVRLLVALWGIVVQASQLTAFDTVIPLFVERTFGWDAIGAGLIFLAVMVPSFFAPVVGWVSDNYGPRWLCVTGFVMAIPFWILLRLVDHNSLGQKVLLCALLALIGASLTLVMPPLMAEITYVVEAKERVNPGCFGSTGAYAQAYGLFVTAYAAGTLIGPLWSGYVEDAAGWGTMAWSLGLFSISAAIPCLIYTGGRITDINAKSGEERNVGNVDMGEV